MDNTAHEIMDENYLFAKNATKVEKVARVVPLRSVPKLNSVDSWFWGMGQGISQLKSDMEFSLNPKLNVLIVGETGTGKELLARRIHQERKRRELLSDVSSPFISINCSTVPEALAESILFGHERGAFTSARERQAGKFEIAKSGTLFLDEVQSLSLDTQAKLLRVLQEREVERLGGRIPYKIDCKIIAATNMPLEILVEQKKFRRDLYFRLNICPLYIPALRHRKEDLPAIIKGLLNKSACELRRNILEISPPAYEMILNYAWPGNLRELEHALTYGLLRATDCLEIEHLPPSLTGKLGHYLSTGEWV